MCGTDLEHQAKGVVLDIAGLLLLVDDDLFTLAP